MSENKQIINCSFNVKSKYGCNPGFEETGSIIIRLLHKTQIGETSSLDQETSNIQDIYITPSSKKISKELFRLCNQYYADYYVESILQYLEVDPDCIKLLKPQIVSAVVNKAIETQHNGYREFEMIVDIELTTIELILRESAMEEEYLQWVMMESIEESMNSSMNSKKNPASKSSIDKLKRGFFEGGGVGDDELVMKKNCAVCLDDFEIGSKVTWMPCSHMFHEGCLDSWLKESNSCPLCRLFMCI